MANSWRACIPTGVGRSIVALALGLAASLCEARTASASDLDVTWTAPRDCPDREGLRQGLSRRLGREVVFGSDAPVGVSGSIVAQGSGYELELETRSHAGSERRTLQARSCSELARASLLIAALLLSDAPDDLRRAPLARKDAAPSERVWFLFARARVIGDLGSLESASVGPGLGLGFGIDRTLVEIGGLLLPSQALTATGLDRAPASLQLMAASAGLCHAFGGGPTLAPCLHFEAGRLTARGRELAGAVEAGATWLSAAAGVRASVRLFQDWYCVADLRVGAPLGRPRFGVRGIGEVYAVPPVIGRLELSFEGRL